jgi:lipoprotein-anchoring transpeptidase ErfK/SrfK
MKGDQMKFFGLVRAVSVFAVCVVASASAEAAKVTFYDPASKSFVTYDPDSMRQKSGIARPRQDRRQQASAPRMGRAATPGRQFALPTAFPVAPALPQTTHPEPGPEFDRQLVDYQTEEAPGTIVIDTEQKFLYYVMEGGQAIRYGVGVGKEGFGWTGTVTVGNLQEWPKWFPPADMVKRRPELAQYQKVGMSGGEGNPLGARAIYLHDDKGKDTLFRIHGTNEPWSIGLNVSSGCIRMLNENVTELHSLVKIGAKVIVT